MPSFMGISSYYDLGRCILSMGHHLTRVDVLVIVLGTSFCSYLVFHRYQPQRAPLLALLLVALPALLVLPLSVVFSSLFAAALVAYGSYWTLLVLFTAAYRLSPLHPLAQYPGPLLPRLSKWIIARKCTRGRTYLWYHALHQQYGDVVRVGPNELSFGHASAIPDILGGTGATSGLPKGPYWAHRDYPANLISERTLARHAILRKEWSRGFTTLALKDYEPMVMGRVRQLLESLQERCSLGGKGAVLDIASWASYFATDFMGDLMFGGGFELMEHGGDKHGFWDLLESGLESTAFLSHVSWAIPFFRLIPGSGQSVVRFRSFGRQKVHERLHLGARRKDLFYYLSSEDQAGRVARPAAEVANDGILAIIAGSDTTATTLSALVFHLLSNPAAYKQLQEEVDAAFPQGEEPHDTAKMAGMEYLNACLNEALRLTPAVPNGSPRGVPRGAGPQIISGHVVPEGTQVFVHTWTVHRDPRNFAHPTSYMPERWFSAENNTAACIPFSHGPANCVGKNLALMEMRMVVCALLQHFELRPAEGLEQWEDSLEEYFVFKKSPLPVRFIPRA